jgi:para-nitrobenzyl esterase|tara:strand:- start:3327 stop:4859 length:1533 start_codon:yes stop_codon:yes gene_type:complete
MAAEATITSGRLRGTVEQGVHAFKGIPYAAAPVGDLRLRPPVPPAAWDGVRSASDYGLTAIQQAMPGIFGELGTPQSPTGDDCLNLNVWTPDPGAAGLPVLVWIHGGAFYAGSGVDDVYNGAAFARDGIVCVTINYRLGVQGFWHLAEHFAELSESGNLGLLDQVAALEWVRDNIAAFGGDPARVTIAGESAGGMSATSLMTMPAARGLFQRAIPQSGAGHNGLGAETASMIGGHMLDILGVAPGDLDALQRVPNDILLDAQVKLGDELQTTRDPSRFGEAAASAMAFQPTYGTDALPLRPIDAIAAGAAADIDLMVGTTRDEALIFIVDLRDIFNEELVAMTVDAVFGMAGRDGSAVLDVYRSNRPDAEPHEIAAAIESDRMFIVPAIRMADAQVAHNPNTRLYRFDWQADVADGAWGAHHFIEVPFAFDQLDNPQARGFIGDDPPRPLAAATHAAWVGFVRDGDPNHEGLPDWPRYDAETRPTMLFDDTCSVANRPADDEVSLWEGVV